MLLSNTLFALVVMLAIAMILAMLLRKAMKFQKNASTLNFLTILMNQEDMQPCGAYLMKIIKTSSDAHTRVKPIKLYAYQSLKVAMTNLLNRYGFLKQCEQWRKREKTLLAGYLGDIFDGRVWQSFYVKDDIDFLNLPYNYCLSLNLDWFQPYSHTRKCGSY